MKIALLIALLPLLPACGDVGRSNPYDPSGGNVIDLRTQLVGSWSRESVEQNQIYIFKEDSRAELRDFSAPEGGSVDRDGAFPQTLVYSFSGTYMLVGDRLSITFTDVQINDPSGTPPLLGDKVVYIRIANNELIMKDIDGDRTYVRF